jgi:hypothetical protein
MKIVVVFFTDTVLHFLKDVEREEKLNEWIKEQRKDYM